MSANWIDIRAGDKPRKVVTYLNNNGVRVPHVVHLGGKALRAVSLRNFLLAAQEVRITLPPVHEIVELTKAATDKLLEGTVL